jgi:6-phosphogluconolactonase
MKHTIVILLLLATVLLPVAATFAQQNSKKSNARSEYTVYVGTFTGGRGGSSKGIYSFRFQPATGTLGAAKVVAETDSPSFLAVNPTNQFLYSVNNIMNYQGQNAGSVSSFAIDPATGDLKFLNRVSSHSPGPTHLSVDHTSKALLVANYQGGSVASFPIKADGSLGEMVSFDQHSGSSVNPARPAVPHAHEMAVSPDNRFVFTPELGLDRVMSYRLDPVKATLTPNEPAFVAVNPGSGPRHMIFHPNGRFAYSVNETGSSVTGYTYDRQRGILTVIETLPTIPEDFKGTNAAAEIATDPAGKFLYASNRGHDTIAVFAIDAAKGTLKPLERIATTGKFPRYFTFDPTGEYVLVAHQNSDNVVLFRFDKETGHLTPTGASIPVPSPVCLLFAGPGK